MMQLKPRMTGTGHTGGAASSCNASEFPAFLVNQLVAVCISGYMLPNNNRIQNVFTPKGVRDSPCQKQNLTNNLSQSAITWKRCNR